MHFLVAALVALSPEPGCLKQLLQPPTGLGPPAPSCGSALGPGRATEAVAAFLPSPSLGSSPGPQRLGQLRQLASLLRWPQTPRPVLRFCSRQPLSSQPWLQGHRPTTSPVSLWAPLQGHTPGLRGTPAEAGTGVSTFAAARELSRLGERPRCSLGTVPGPATERSRPRPATSRASATPCGGERQARTDTTGSTWMVHVERALLQRKKGRRLASRGAGGTGCLVGTGPRCGTLGTSGGDGRGLAQHLHAWDPTELPPDHGSGCSVPARVCPLVEQARPAVPREGLGPASTSHAEARRPAQSPSEPFFG